MRNAEILKLRRPKRKDTERTWSAFAEVLSKNELNDHVVRAKLQVSLWCFCASDLRGLAVSE